MKTKLDRKKKIIIAASVAVVVLLAGAGGAWWTIRRNADPMLRAAQFESRGDLRSAQLELRTAIRQDNRNGEAHLRLGKLLMNLSDPVAAEKKFRIARGLGLDRWLVLPLLGDSFLAQSKFPDILSEMPRTGPTPAVAARFLLQRAIAQIETHDLGAAQATLAAAQRLAPREVQTALIGARVDLATGDKGPAAIKIDEALKLDPNQLDALLMKGRLLVEAGQNDQALAVVERAVQAAPYSPIAKLDRANVQILLGHDALARADIATVQDVAPRDARAIYLNGVLLARSGRFADASLAFDQLRNVSDQFPRAAYVQALVAVNLGNIESAVDLARRFNARSPQDLDGIHLLARTELLAKRPERTVAVLQPLVKTGQVDPVTLDLLGQAYAALGDHANATLAFQQAAALAPGDAGIATRLGLSQMAQGNAASAATLKRSLDLRPDQPLATEALITTAIDAGDYDKAGTELDRLQQQQGETAHTGVLAATIQLARGDLDAARSGLTALIRKYPDDVEVKVNLAKVFVLQDRRQEGDTLLRDTLAKNPANMPALTAYLQYILQGAPGPAQYAAAIRALEAANVTAPNDPLLTAMLSDMLVRSGNTPRAVAMMQKRRDATAPPPNQTDSGMPAILLGALARAQAASGMTDDAKATYAAQLQASPTDLEARRALTELLLRGKDFAGARKVLNEGLALMPGIYGMMSTLVGMEAQTTGLDPALAEAASLRATPANMPAAAVLKGDLLMQLRRYPEALQSFVDEKPAIAAFPAFESSLTQRIALANLALKQDNQATAILSDFLASHPNDPVIARMLAQLDVKAKRWDDAQAHLETVLSVRPDDLVALNNLAWIYQSKGDRRARPTAQRAYLEAPTAATADTLGWIMVQQKDAAAALPVLQQAMRQATPSPALIFHLATALDETGDPGQAVALLTPLLATSENFDGRPEAQALLTRLRPPSPVPTR